MASNTNISSIDLGLPLEAQVLSQFFDEDFVPVDYINALLSTSLNVSSQTNNINNKSNELHSSVSLKLLFQRLSALSLHFNEYTNELTKRFDQSYSKLLTSSSQIISYNNQISVIDNDLNNNDFEDIITRLQYHLATLNTSMYSLLEDLKNTKNNLSIVDPYKKDNKTIDDLKTLVLIKCRINEVKESFELLKSLVASVEADTLLENPKNKNNISIDDFKKSLVILHDLIQDQISNEIKIYQEAKSNNKDVIINEKLIKIIDNMINLQPFFKSLIHFQIAYASFVDFLKVQKNNYLNLFNHDDGNNNNNNNNNE
jgi:hypothetical protein